ncbi:MAG: cysteine desulfurase [Chlorobiaceae bacterium]|nr:cysteine desulfurase [Chlorobiaceae bacterium]
MPESGDHINPAGSVPELLNPSFIAQVASRLFNELPGGAEVPRSETELQHAPESAATSAREQATQGPVAGDPAWQPALPWFPAEAQAPGEGNAFYFTREIGTNREEALEPHAERLTEEQNYTPDGSGSYGLEEQLRKNPAEPALPAELPGLPSPDSAISFDFLRQAFQPFQSIAGLDNGRCFAEELLRKAAGDGGSRAQAPVAEPSAFGPHYLFTTTDTPGNPAAAGEVFDVVSVRKDFPVLHQKVHGKDLVWFDNAATTQKPVSVIEAVWQFYATDNSNIHRGAHTLAARATDAYEGAREKIRRFINAGSSSEIVYVRGTTEAINLVAQTWGRKFIQPGDEIVLSILEHHANIVPWQMLAQEKGAVIRVVPVNDRGEIILEEYTRLLGPRTRFVSLTQASNGLGTILPVREMIRLAKRHDAKVLVDGAQSVAHIPVDIQDLDADFFVFSGHKIFAPTGIGVLYGKRELLDVMPPWHGGGNMIKDVRFDHTSYNEAPAKFEAGTPSIADAVGLGAALDYVRKLGLENIARYEHELTVYATEKLAAIPGLRQIGTAHEKVGVLSFVLDGVPIDEVGRALDREGIAVRAGHHCTQPSLRRFGVEGTVRPSLAFYNTRQEIDRLVDVVRSIRRG